MFLTLPLPPAFVTVGTELLKQSSATVGTGPVVGCHHWLSVEGQGFSASSKSLPVPLPAAAPVKSLALVRVAKAGSTWRTPHFKSILLERRLIATTYE